MKEGTVNDTEERKSITPILRNSVTELIQTKDWLQIESQKYTKFFIHVSRHWHTLANCTNYAVTT
jgi:hypothetical protein